MTTDLALYAQIIWTSVANSSYQVLFTVAFALVLKVLRIWNFAQPALMAVSFYAMYAAITLLRVPPLPAMGLAVIVTVALACAMERWAFANLRERNSDPLAFFIFTIVFSQFVIYVLTLLFTAEPRFLFATMTSPVHMLMGLFITDWDLGAIATTVVLLVLLHLFMSYSRSGQFIMAVADNAELAESYGIDKGRCYLLTMAIAAVLINTAVFIFGSKFALYPELSLQMMLFAVAATIIGGIGNIFGAALAALVIVLAQQSSILVIGSRWQPLLIFLILFATIIFFPRGVRLRARS